MPLVLAGLRGAWLQSFTIITTTPNALTEDNRMLVILHKSDWDE